MKKALIVVMSLLAALTVPLVGAQGAWASCPPDGPTTIYNVSNKVFTYYPTNLYSSWESLSHGGTITYSQSATGTVNASVTATASADAGVLFASVSTSIGVTVGKSWAKTKTWTYSANVPADTAHKYRLHLYRYSVTFTVTKQEWNYGKCGWTTQPGYPNTVSHAPATADDENYNVWRLDSAAA